MKKCMNCGFENLDDTSICVVCNEALTIGFHREEKNIIKNIECENCSYPLIIYLTYFNCPHCGEVFGQKKEDKVDLQEGNLETYEKINIKIIINSSVLGELTINKGQIIFKNPKDYQHKRSLKINSLQDNGKKTIKYNKFYGKRKIEDTFDVDIKDIIEFSSKEDNMLIEVNFK